MGKGSVAIELAEEDLVGAIETDQCTAAELMTSMVPTSVAEVQGRHERWESGTRDLEA